ncbi:MAG: hypothetical protein K1W30_02935 [Lachnospiraceae bacterium]
MRRELVLLGVMSILFTPVFAETLEMNNMASFQIQSNSLLNEGITPYADSIVTKYKLINSKLYYRRWNESKGYWVDSDWIPYNP